MSHHDSLGYILDLCPACALGSTCTSIGYSLSGWTSYTSSTGPTIFRCRRVLELSAREGHDPYWSLIHQRATSGPLDDDQLVLRRSPKTAKRAGLIGPSRPNRSTPGSSCCTSLPPSRSFRSYLSVYKHAYLPGKNQIHYEIYAATSVSRSLLCCTGVALHLMTTLRSGPLNH